MKQKLKILCRCIMVICAIVMLMHIFSIICLSEIARGILIIMAVIASIINYVEKGK